MNTPLDRLYANLGGIITDALPWVQPVSDEKLTALAESLYLEVVAEYQPEPAIYGVADDDVEEEWATEAEDEVAQ
jgi:hypothetical protein